MALPDQYAVEADCVKFCDDDYLNNPPEEEKAFWERREKEGAPIDWPDYEEWSRGYDAFKVRERAMYRSASAAGSSCCRSTPTRRSWWTTAASTSASGSAI